MTSLDPILPGFIKACAQLYAALLPWGMALLVTAFAVEFWHGAPTAADLIKLLVKVFLVVLLVAKSQDLINDGQKIVQQWVEHYVPALPENVAARYKEKLAEAQNDPSLGDRSFLGTLFSSDWFEAIIFAVLTLVSWLAMAVLFFVYCVQRAALLLCWVLSPLLFPLMAIRPLSGMGHPGRERPRTIMGRRTGVHEPALRTRIAQVDAQGVRRSPRQRGVGWRRIRGELLYARYMCDKSPLHRHGRQQGVAHP